MEGRGRNRLAVAGVVVAVATVLVPILWPVALVLGILLLVRKHTRAGVFVLVAGVVLLPLVGAALWQAVLIKPYRAPTESMVPAVELGDRFIVWRLGYEPKVGDIAVFHAPAGAETNQCGVMPEDGAVCSRPAPGLAGVDFLKRVVAGPGDRVRMEKGRVIRNGRPESGYRLRPCGSGDGCDYPTEVTIPAGHWFVLGDNRGASDDSRFWGPVPTDAFVGRKVLTYWSG